MNDMEGPKTEGILDRHRAITERVIGVFYSVANELGHGFLESVYRSAMLISLREAGLKAEEEVPLAVWFHGEQIGIFRADLLVNEVLILELKTGDEISKAYEAQLLNYLRSSRIEIGFVLCFGEKAKFRRVIMQNNRKKISPMPYCP